MFNNLSFNFEILIKDQKRLADKEISAVEVEFLTLMDLIS